MPVWRIFAHPSIFTHDQKRSFAEDVTAMYVSRGLPKFYVNVLFIPLEEDELWIGGEPRNDFVRIIIEQIARQLVNKDEDVEGLRKKFMERVNSTIKPHIADRGDLDWEHHVYETPRDLWRINGIDPPPAFSDAEKTWQTENKAIEYRN